MEPNLGEAEIIAPAVQAKSIDFAAVMTVDPIEIEVVHEAPVFKAATSTPTEQGDLGREGEVELITVRTNEAITDLDKTALLEIRDESSARSSKQHEKTPMTVGPHPMRILHLETLILRTL